MIHRPERNTQFSERLYNIIESRMTDPQFGVSELAQAMGMSRSTLHRKVRKALGKSVTSLISETRLKKAMQLLITGDYKVSEVAWETGFGSTTYFNKCFHDYFGYPPGEAVNRTFSESGPEITADPKITEPAVSKRLRNRIIAGSLSGIVLAIAGYLMLQSNFFSGRPPEKSIAVMPFINDSPDSTNVYFINGVADAIMDRLFNISDIKVTSRTTAESYRGKKRISARKIARKLGVNYIVEGSGQKLEDEVLISVQMIDARNDRHILSRQYTRKYEDVLELYSEIAVDVALQIRAVITPEEKKKLENPGTKSVEALRMYIQGSEFYDIKFIKPEQSVEYVRQAEMYARKALELDSCYSDALALLGETCLFTGRMDSAIILADQALYYNPENPKAYMLTANIHTVRRNAPELEKSILNLLKYEPDNIWAKHMLGGLKYHRGEFRDAFLALLETREWFGSPDPGFSHMELVMAETNTLRIARCLFAQGYYEEGKRYAKEWLAMSNKEYWGYNYNVQWGGMISGRFAETHEWTKDLPQDLIARDYFGMNLMFMNRYTEAADYLLEVMSILEKEGNSNRLMQLLTGFACLKTGKTREARDYFEQCQESSSNLLALHPETALPDVSYAITDRYWKSPLFALASIHAARGEKSEAMKYMRQLRKNYLANDLQVVMMLEIWPMFDNIRDEPEFQDYLRMAKKHFEKEHIRVDRLLRQRGIITNNEPGQDPRSLPPV